MSRNTPSLMLGPGCQVDCLGAHKGSHSDGPLILGNHFCILGCRVKPLGGRCLLQVSRPTGPLVPVKVLGISEQTRASLTLVCNIGSLLPRPKFPWEQLRQFLP